MSKSTDTLEGLRRLIRRERIVELPALCVELGTQSRMTVFRRLREVGYRTSYTHRGRFYTLADVPDFDEQGLWFFRNVGFSRVGTLKETAACQVLEAPDGRTHAELQDLLHVRIHNTLLELVREGRIGCERHEGTLVYMNTSRERAAEQLARRREGAQASAELARKPTDEETIQVLAEALQSSAELPRPEEIAKRLSARGVEIGYDRVRQVFEAHGLLSEKKTVPPG